MTDFTGNLDTEDKLVISGVLSLIGVVGGSIYSNVYVIGVGIISFCFFLYFLGRRE